MTTTAEPQTLPMVIDAESGIPLSALSIVGGEIFVAGKPLTAYDAKQIIDFRTGLLLHVTRVGVVEAACRRVVAAKMEADKATTLYHPDYDVTYLPSDGDESFDDALLHKKLTALAKKGECDPKVVAQAVWLDKPKPQYKHHKTYLAQLKKLGGGVLAAIDAHWRVGEPGAPVLSIKAKKK